MIIKRVKIQVHNFTVNRQKLFCEISVLPVVQSLSQVQVFVTPCTAARQAFLSNTISWSLPKFMSIEFMKLSNHLILSPHCPPALNLSQHQDLFQ